MTSHSRSSLLKLNNFHGVTQTEVTASASRSGTRHGVGDLCDKGRSQNSLNKHEREGGTGMNTKVSLGEDF